MFNRRRAALSFTYSFGQIFLGLLLHPFQTMRMLVEDKYWAWLSFLPLLLLILAFILWHVLVYFLPSIFDHQFFLLELLKWWVFYFCFFWQFILISLLIKFWKFFYA